MNFEASKSNGFIVGLSMGVLIFGFIIWGIGFSLTNNDRALKLLLYIPTYLFLILYTYLLLGATNLRYILLDNRMVINWGTRKIQIKWDEITEIIKVEGKSNMFSILGISWPGYMIGLYSAKGLGLARMYATNPHQGFIYLKTEKGLFGITPENADLAELIAEKTNKPVETVNMDLIDKDVKGTSLQDDFFYRLLLKFNIIMLLAFGIYMGVFFPGSGAPRFIVLLLVLGVALFFFNISNAGKLFQFSDTGGYILLLIGLAVTGTFFILALSEISLK
ncbi:MAG: PH domain-containing protein [Syntrophomonas sp.]